MTPRPTRKRVVDVPREPARVRSITDADGVLWRPKSGGFTDEFGSIDWAALIRDNGPLTVELPARPERPKPVWSGSRTTADLVAYAEQQVSYLAHIASECMQDNLGDDQIVHDMHDAIGSLASLRSALNLIEANEEMPDAQA